MGIDEFFERFVNEDGLLDTADKVADVVAYYDQLVEQDWLEPYTKGQVESVKVFQLDASKIVALAGG